MGKPGQSDSLGVRLQLSAAAALVSESCTFPVDLVKTRLQLQGEGVRQAAAHRLGAFGMATHIVRHEGPLGLLRGVSPALLRHVVYTPIRIVLYEQLRRTVSHGGDGHHLPTWKLMLVGATSGGVAQLAASPFDLLKVRMQAEGKKVAMGGKAQYRGVFDALRSIYVAEGVAGLWRGWSPNVQRAAFVNLGELATYDTGKQHLLRSGYFEDNVWCHLAASVISGLVSSAVSCPADVVKTRIMSSLAASQSGKEPLYRGTVDCLAKVVRQEGVFSLWKGFFPTWARLAPWQLIFWVSYEKLRSVRGVESF